MGKRGPKSIYRDGDPRVCTACNAGISPAGRRICWPCHRKVKLDRRGIEHIRALARARYQKEPTKTLARRHSTPAWLGARSEMITATSDGTLTMDRVTDLFAAAKECPYCGEAMAGKRKSLDHISPVASGGTHSIRNVLICCRNCNSAKGKLGFDDWLVRVADRFGADQAAIADRAHLAAAGRAKQHHAA